MHRLTSSFVLGYHGCDRKIGETLLRGDSPKPSRNKYDWLGPGMYFWESNPLRGLEFAREAAKRKGSRIADPFVIGAVIDLGLCLDLTTTGAVEWLKIAYESLAALTRRAGMDMPVNTPDGRRRNLDCAVISQLHHVLAERGLPPVDTVKGIFVEGAPIYPGAALAEKTHIQIAVCRLDSIKGFFRVPSSRPLQ